MRTTTAAVAGRQPLRSPLDDLDDPVGFRRGELAAGLATAAIAGQLLFAQVTLVTAVGLVALGRVSRWRPHWLAVPAFASVVWLLAVGAAAAAAAFAAGSRQLAGYLLAAAIHPGLLARPDAAVAGASRWLSSELPLALLAACGEAWLVLWLGWWRRKAGSQSQWRWRPGLVAVVRRRISTAALTAGHAVTTDGCALGVVTGTGKLAGFSWAEATRGVLLTGRDAELLGIAAACAALRRRKTVLILECTGQAASAAVTSRVRNLAKSLGVPVTDAGGRSVAGAFGRAIRRRETMLIATSDADHARLATDGLTAVLSGLRDLALRADCLAWISGCEFMDAAGWSELVALGRVTGTTIVLTTTRDAHAASLAPAAAVVAASGPVAADVALAIAARVDGARPAAMAIGRDGASHAQLGAADALSRPLEAAAGGRTDDAGRAIANILMSQRSGEFTILAFPAPDDGPSRVITSCRAVAVPVTPDRPQ
jgi:hypothetical protein